MNEPIFLYDVDTERKVATITLNRPGKLNAFTAEERGELAELFEKPQRDDNVKVIILKGAGRAFCTGHLLDTMMKEHGFASDAGAPKPERPPERWKLTADDKYLLGPRGLFQTITYCNKATIAQVHGYCYGGGLTMALACDITIAAEGTMFGHPGYRYMGPSAEGFHIPMILNIGVKRMMELLLTGRPFDAREAQRIGIVNKVVPPDELEKEVQRYADTIALLSLDGIVVGKYSTRLALDRLGYGGITPVVAHNMGSNVKWDPGDFNILKEKRDKGTRAAIKAREARYAELGMDLKSAKKAAGLD